MTTLNDTIREVFLANGFTIKDGQTDLKPYVYEAAHALLSKLRAPVADERVPHHDQPQQTGVGEWCAPGPATEQRQTWMLRFADTERGECIYYDEQEARRAFAQAEGRGWNCYLFEYARRAALASAPVHKDAPVDTRTGHSAMPTLTGCSPGDFTYNAEVVTVDEAKAYAWAALADIRHELNQLGMTAHTALNQDARDMRNIMEDLAERLLALAGGAPVASAPVAGEAAYYAVMHGQALYGIFDSEAAAEACKEQGHPDAPFSVKPLYATPPASEAIYLDAGHLREVLAGNDMPVSASTEPGHGMVPYYAAPQASEAECSCPSGNGSLRHPCAVHPQASEADDLIDALGKCRDAFPIPDKVGSKLDLLWQEAMSDPTAVPEYVKLCAALSAQPGAQSTGGSDV